MTISVLFVKLQHTNRNRIGSLFDMWRQSEVSNGRGVTITIGNPCKQGRHRLDTVYKVAREVNIPTLYHPSRNPVRHANGRNSKQNATLCREGGAYEFVFLPRTVVIGSQCRHSRNNFPQYVVSVMGHSYFRVVSHIFIATIEAIVCTL